MPEHNPKISFVCVSRNDDHGGSPTERLIYSCKHFINQCETYHTEGEYVIVEWNPPDGRPRLNQCIPLRSTKFCKIRIITVPPEIHNRYRFADKLPLFQMIGKNAGIRRAKGQYILSSNIDILLSKHLFLAINKKTLQKNIIYRSHRLDLSNQVLQEEFREESAFRLATRINFPNRTLNLGSGQEVIKNFGKSHASLTKISFYLHLHRLQVWLRRKASRHFKDKFPLHTNACGDFQLLHRDGWFALEGFSEMEVYSFHLDALFMFNALRKGVYSLVFPPPAYHFHIDHSDGWAPESAGTLFTKLAKNGIGFLDEEISIFEELHRRNEIDQDGSNPGWGLADCELEEITLV